MWRSLLPSPTACRGGSKTLGRWAIPNPVVTGGLSPVLSPPPSTPHPTPTFHPPQPTPPLWLPHSTSSPLLPSFPPRTPALLPPSLPPLFSFRVHSRPPPPLPRSLPQLSPSPPLFFSLAPSLLMARWLCGLLGLLALVALHCPQPVLSQFSLDASTLTTPFNGRFGATLVSLPYSLPYISGSYVINATAPCTSVNSQCLNAPYTLTPSTTPNNSLFLFGGQCGHAANALSVLGDPDVWTSADGGVTWSLFSGAHGLSGSAQAYVQALSANTPNWQGSNPANYPTSLTAPTTYSIYPGSVGVHDNVHRQFHLLGGDFYYGSGVWRPTSFAQNSGGLPSLNSSVNGAPLNTEGVGWTNLCLDPVGGLTYSTCDSFTVRTSGASTSDSRGNIYVLNGVAEYDTNLFPWILQGDVWMSSNGALTWTQQAATTPWSGLGNGGRMESAATSFYSTVYSADVLYSIGGCGTTTSTGFNTAGASLTEVGYADVYASINQGISWYTVTSSAAFSPRCGLTAVVSTGGVLVVVGGRTPQTYTAAQTGWPTYYTTTLGLTTLTDVWTSLDGGVQWYLLSSTGGRDRAAITLDVQGFLHVVGGKTGLGTAYNTVACPTDAYTSSQSFNSISSWIQSVVPGATVPAATGLRAAGVSASVTPINPFNMTALNGGAGFNGRAGAGLTVLPNAITFKTWSYIINATYPTRPHSPTPTLPASPTPPYRPTSTPTQHRPTHSSSSAESAATESTPAHPLGIPTCGLLQTAGTRGTS